MTEEALFVEYTDPETSCVTDSLYEQYCSGEHVDVTLRTENESVVLHGFVLAAQSDLLTRFSVQEGDTSKLGIDLTKICDSIKHLRSVVDYLYKRTITLDMTNIKAILKLGQYCSFHRLLVHCKQFLLNRMQPYNCLEIWRIARSFHLPDIEAMALSLIREVFWEMCSQDPTLKDIGTKEMSFLMDRVSVPRKPAAAFEFITYWLSGNFSDRFTAVTDYVQRFVSSYFLPESIVCLEALLAQDEQYRPLLNFLQTLATDTPEKLSKYYNSPFSSQEAWVLVLSEKNFSSIYFPTENQWTSHKYETENIEIIGILGQTVVSWDEEKKQIEVFNLETLTSRFLPACPQFPDVFTSKYFCTNTGIHMVACSWYGCGFKIIFWRYKYGWEKRREMLLSCSIQTAYMRIEPCPDSSDMVYILLTSKDAGEEIDTKSEGCLLLRYNSVTCRVSHVFSSAAWAPLVEGRLLCIYKTVNFIEDTTSAQMHKSLNTGKLTVKSITGLNELKTVDIPLPISKRKRPDNITISSEMADNMQHFDTDQFTFYEDNIFWLEQVSPTVVSVNIYNFNGNDQWIEIPPSPLLGLSRVKMKLFNRNTILRGGFHVDNEKQLISKNAFPLVNLSIDLWKGDVLT